MRRLIGAVVIAAPFVVGTLSASAADRDVVLRFEDPAILESSGLVVTDDLVVTMNDSGDSARVFTVDPSTGQTLGTISYDGRAQDVEALAPGDDGTVWVADIGDNLGKRHDISVAEVPVGPADAAVQAASYPLAFKDGPRDVEALLRHPGTGRLYVVSKGVLGGQFFAAPERLSTQQTNRLTPVGDAPGLVTDGAFFPDGEHLIVRNYGRAMVYTFPDLDLVGAFDLPEQQQGEGLAVAPDGRVYLSSEGVHAQVLRVALPADVRKAMEAGDSASPSAGESNSPSTPPRRAKDYDRGGDPEEADESDGSGPDVVPWVLGGLAAAVMLVVLARSVRPR